MNGKFLMGGMLGFAAIFGAMLFYFQNYAFYEPVVVDPQRTGDQTARVEPPEEAGATNMTTIIRLTPLVGGAPEPIIVTAFTGIDAATSPLKFRGCFKVASSLGFLTETYQVFTAATPLKAPGWFDCFDSEQLTQDIASGRAVAFLGEKDIARGADRIVAVYDDGRAFAWHQLTDTYSE